MNSHPLCRDMLRTERKAITGLTTPDLQYQWFVEQGANPIKRVTRGAVVQDYVLWWSTLPYELLGAWGSKLEYVP